MGKSRMSGAGTAVAEAPGLEEVFQAYRQVGKAKEDQRVCREAVGRLKQTLEKAKEDKAVADGAVAAATDKVFELLAAMQADQPGPGTSE